MAHRGGGWAPPKCHAGRWALRTRQETRRCLPSRGSCSAGRPRSEMHLCGHAWCRGGGDRRVANEGVAFRLGPQRWEASRQELAMQRGRNPSMPNHPRANWCSLGFAFLVLVKMAFCKPRSIPHSLAHSRHLLPQLGLSSASRSSGLAWPFPSGLLPVFPPPQPVCSGGPPARDH